MKIAFIALIFALVATSPGLAQVQETFTPFSNGDFTLEVAWQLANIIDWGQTLDISKNPDRYHEINPLIGSHPSEDRVNGYMAASALFHALVSWALPGYWRTAWQVGTLGITCGLVVHNKSIGLRVNF